ETLELRERRIAGAEIVDRELHAHRFDREQLLDGAVDVVHDDTLGQLELEQLRRHPALLERVADIVQQMRVLELPRRKIDADTDRLQPEPLPCDVLLASGS